MRYLDVPDIREVEKIEEVPQAGRWVGGSVGRWVGGSVGRWVGGSVGRWVGGSVGRWVGGSVGRWVGGSVGRWVGGSVGRWVGGSVGRWVGGSVGRWRRGAGGGVVVGWVGAPVFLLRCRKGKPASFVWDLASPMLRLFLAFLVGSPIVEGFEGEANRRV